MDTNISQLLIDWNEGKQEALNKLMPMVYDELRRLAKSYLSREPKNITLQPTALVNEAYLRLVQQQNITLENRVQFFGFAAKVMRNILVDSARHRRAEKRGSGEFLLSLGAADEFAPQADINLLALDDALTELANLKPVHARVIELRFFGGLTIEETANALKLSPATIERSWTFAKAWLKKEMTKV
jgi:RNA polymerase sigma-70 factor, ECF subfamily